MVQLPASPTVGHVIAVLQDASRCSNSKVVAAAGDLPLQIAPELRLRTPGRTGGMDGCGGPSWQLVWAAGGACVDERANSAVLRGKRWESHSAVGPGPLRGVRPLFSGKKSF